MSDFEHEQVDAPDEQSAKLSVPTAVTPVDAEPFELPEPPDLPKCQNCGIGFLAPIGFDAEALHENQPKSREGDPSGHSHYLASGGALYLRCFICEQTQTQPYGADPAEREAALAEQADIARIEARSAKVGG